MKKLTAIVSVLSLALAGCTVAKPYAKASNAPKLKEGEPVVVVITQAKLDTAKRKPFDEYTSQLIDKLDKGAYPGLVGYSVRKELFGDELWTLTVWADRDSMKRFARSGLHQRAIDNAMDPVISFKTKILTVPQSEIPMKWKTALEHLKTADERAGADYPTAKPAGPTAATSATPGPS